MPLSPQAAAAVAEPSPGSLRDRLATLDRRGELRGRQFCRASTEVADTWLAELFATAIARAGAGRPGVALLAVGSYGRGELTPGSDLDLLLVHDRWRRAEMTTLADALWYPIWDDGISLDHSVRTPAEILTAADSDLRVALGLVDARLIAGDAQLAAATLQRVERHWQAGAGRWLPELIEGTEQRQRDHGDLAFLLEPDLKESHGGLRDSNGLRVAATLTPVLAGIVADARLVDAVDTLLAVRVALHRLTKRSSTQLLLQDQDEVAARLGLPDADQLMTEVAAAGRTIAWETDDGWRRVRSLLAGPVGRRASGDRPIGPGLVVRDNEIAVRADALPAADPSLAVRAALASVELDLPVARAALARLGGELAETPDRWPPGLHDAFLRLLGAGPPALAALETLDQLGVLVRLLPEWARVRNRPQRNAYHRFTVDRHLLETALNAAGHLGDVRRPDLLLAAGLLHDIGKGYPGDHTDAGVAVVGGIAARLGFTDEDGRVLVNLVRHHLLLADVATRRDLSDPATIAAVAGAVGDRVTLELLSALTQADSLATGPAAWGSWKAGLVATLVERVAARLGGDLAPPPPPQLTAAQQALVGQRRLAVVTEESDAQPAADRTARVTVVVPDRAGVLATVAGVLTLSGVTVQAAVTHSDAETGMAALVFDVFPAFDRLPVWERVRQQLIQALDGRLALEQRLAERHRAYRSRSPAAGKLTEVRVQVDNETASASTVVEVRTPDRGAVLYRIARALTDCGLVINSARVTTLGGEVIDAFYVQRPDGAKVATPATGARIESAIVTELERGDLSG